MPDNQTNPVAIAAELANRLRAQGSSPTEFPHSELRALTEAGLLTIALPPENNNIATLLRVLKEVGRASLPLGRIFEGHLNALLLLQQFGSPEQIVAATDEVAHHGAVYGVWNTGPAGSPRLTPGPNGTHVLSGSKTFATAAARLPKAIVTAALPDGGWQMCLVPLNETGISVRTDTWSPLGMEASESFHIQFADVSLPPHALLGKPGDYYAEPTFTAGAFRFSAVQLGGAQALFDDCCTFVRSAGWHENPLVKQRIGQMAVLLQSGELWLAQAGKWLEESSTNLHSLPAHAHMVRIVTEDICTRLIQLTEQTVGARGLTMPEPFARTLRDLQMYLRQAGFDAAFQDVAQYALREQPPHE